MRIIRFFLKHSRKIVLMSVFAGVLSGAFNASLLAVINASIKSGTRPIMLVLGYCGLCLLLPLSRFAAELLLTRLGQESMYKLRMQLCGQVLGAPLRHLEQLGASRILACLADDIPSVTNAVSAIPLLCVNAALVIGCLIYIATLSLTVFGLVLTFMLIGIVSYQIPIIKVQKLFIMARKDADSLQQHFQALTHGVKELKIHSGRREAFIKDGLDATASSLRQHNTSGLKLYSAAASWGQTLVFVVVGLVIFLLPTIRQLSTPTLVGYTLTLLYLMTPLQVILNALPAMSRANIALQKVEDLGLTLDKQGTEARADVNGLPMKWEKLEVKGITHRYHREDEVDDFVLGPIDMDFRPGEMVFIVGGNGSGKTTLLKLLTGLYLPEEGGIYLDGRPIDGEGVEVYRQYFSVVFSDFYLFDQMLGLIGPETDQQAREYLAQLKLSQKVEIKDGKLSTTDLSQGQRKRLALLTAYLEDRPIYVFDEWAADQDPHFKSVFYMRLLPELKAKGKTVFVISHDDRYYQVADRIIKLDEGKVVSDTANGAGTDYRYTAEVRAAI